MADQVRRAVAWVYKNAKSFGGDPERIFITSQSSGAHLGGNVVTTDWAAYGVPANVVKGALLCSGMYDLKPVRLSKRSEYVAFTDEVEEKLSSQRHLDRLNCPVIVAYGTYETPEFQRQNREFAAAVKAAGKPVTLLVAEGYNHFEMTETLGNPLSVGRQRDPGADEAVTRAGAAMDMTRRTVLAQAARRSPRAGRPRLKQQRRARRARWSG